LVGTLPPEARAEGISEHSFTHHRHIVNVGHHVHYAGPEADHVRKTTTRHGGHGSAPVCLRASETGHAHERHQERQLKKAAAQCHPASHSGYRELEFSSQNQDLFDRHTVGFDFRQKMQKMNYERCQPYFAKN
jgi:hypothetical protein